MNRDDFLLEKYKGKINSTKGRVDVNGDPIEFRLTFEEWKTLWDEAGLLPNRVNVLSRRNDIGHYEVGNVYVNHQLFNSTEGKVPNTELERKITEYSIRTKIKRRIVKAMIRRGELNL